MKYFKTGLAFVVINFLTLKWFSGKLSLSQEAKHFRFLLTMEKN